MTQYVWKRLPAAGEQMSVGDLEALSAIAEEGDYTSYSKITTILGTQTGGGGQGILIDNSANGSYTSLTYGLVWKADGTVLWEPENTSNIIVPMTMSTLTGKYIIAVNNATALNVFRIYKQGALLQTITLTTGAGGFNSAYQIAVGVSPNGRYIAFGGRDNNTAKTRIEIWEGA